MKILKFQKKITKIMKIIEFHMSKNKIMQILYFCFEKQYNSQGTVKTTNSKKIFLIFCSNKIQGTKYCMQFF